MGVKLGGPVGWFLAAVIGLASPAPAGANEAFVFVTNWFAQAEHGGFYQALAEGIYQKNGLDVTISMGGPQVNVFQLMAAGQADCVMGTSDIQTMQTRAGGVPVVTVAAFFQKDPTVLIAHADVTSIEDLRDKKILISTGAHRSYWPWLKKKYGFVDGQTGPYTFSYQPFIADKNMAQQGYITNDPPILRNLGIETSVFLLSDGGFPAYANTVSCMDRTVADRRRQVGAFVRASAQGWKSYLADPAAGNALIKRDNPRMTDAQLAYAWATMKQTGMVTGGDAATGGIGVVTAAREKASYDFLVGENLLDPAKVSVEATFDAAPVGQNTVLP